MIDNNAVEKFIEDTLAEIKELDLICAKVEKELSDNKGNISSDATKNTLAQKLLEEAQSNAKVEGTRRSALVPQVVANKVAKVSRARNRSFV